MTYAEKLKDPRWQKKRLEKLNDTGFSCENCGSEEKELHVHHKYYKKGWHPWSYEIEDLVVFCSPCHDRWHEAKDQLLRIVGDIITPDFIQRIIGYSLNFKIEDVFYNDLSCDERILGMADFFRTSEEVILSLKTESKENGWPVFSKLLWRQSL